MLTPRTYRRCVFEIRQTNMAAKRAMVHIRRFLKIYSSKFCDIWRNFYFYRILNNKNFKMEVEQTNFVTHLVIKVPLHLKTRLLKFGQISFKWKWLIIVSCVQVHRKIEWANFMWTEQKWNFEAAYNRLFCHGNYENVTFFKFQLVSCNLSLAMICQMTYTR